MKRRAQIESLGGFDAVMKALMERLEKQTKRHQGGSKAIGTAGTSPFGAHGYNPEGVRIGQDESRHRRAIKVWDKREFRNLDDKVALGTRNVKIALRRLRRFAREGAATELDLNDTIRSTARKAGMLDIKMVPERHNAVKVLLLLDIGGSMDDHVRLCETLFSAVRSEFKHLESFYFHNCPYEKLWRDNRRRHDAATSTFEVIRTYPSDWKLIFVGDAAMAQVGDFDERRQRRTLERRLGIGVDGPAIAPVPACGLAQPIVRERLDLYGQWGLMQRLMGGRMFPLTVAGIDNAARALS